MSAGRMGHGFGKAQSKIHPHGAAFGKAEITEKFPLQIAHILNADVWK